MKNFDVAVIGGGASGLMAAISAKTENKNAKIAVVERNDRVGKKLLTTGNGRCNISNCKISEQDYFGETDFFAKAFNLFGLNDTLGFLNNLGIPTCVQDENKVFPISLQAGSVVDQLRFFAEDMGIETITECTVEDIKKENGVFVLNNRISAKKIIISAGGKAAPKTGSDGKGYKLLEKFGHKCTKLYPAIVQIVTQKDKIRPLKGIKFNGCAKIPSKRGVFEEYGEILFTEYGLSGPPILQLSRQFSVEGEKKIILDILPQFTEMALTEEIAKRKSLFKNRPVENLLIGLINKRLGQTVIKNAGIEKLSAPIENLTDKDIKKIAKEIKEFHLEVTGTKSFEQAQVTAGGIETRDFCPETMESKIIPGLYAAGEILNIDGRCGGYNLQWAWTSGYIAGKSAAKSIKN